MANHPAKHTTLLAATLLAAGAVVTSLACHSEAPTPARHGAPRKMSPTGMAPYDQLPVIVRIVGRHQTVTVTAGPEGPLYSAATNDGKIVVAGATLERLRQDHPDLYQQIEPSMAVEANDTAPARPAGESSERADMARTPLMMGSVE
jgi:hypothetical protein